MKVLEMTIDITNVDALDLKIVHGGVVGTLHIEKKGFRFSPPRARFVPEKRIPWNRLSKLIALSNGEI